MNFFSFWRMLFCFAWAPLYIGGGSESDASTNTTTSIRNNVSSVDRRGVASEQAISNTGDFNTINRTENNSLTVQQTDFGSVGAALSGMGTISSKAIDLGQFAIGGAIENMKQQTALNAAGIASAFDVAKQSSANALTTAAQVMGFANTQTVAASDAFKAAKDETNGNRTLMLTALAVVGAVGVAVAMKKG
jgi:hypothetical protein